MERIDTIVVGGGQAGLAMSHHLRRQGREHLVLERGRVAERWRSERWDSLHFQSPNWSIALPGLAFAADDPDGFASRDEVAGFLEAYCARINAPVRTSTEVLRLRRGGAGFELHTAAGVHVARHVIVATGPYQRPRSSPWASGLPGGLLQISASQYRHPGQLPEGAVLVVGSGASGCQISDELQEAGRRVFLSVRRHARVPRRYRGRDVFWWRRALGDLDRATEQTPPSQRTAGPLLTGVHGGYEVDLRRSAQRGVVLLGSLVGAAERRVAFADDLEANVQAGDQSRHKFVARVDAFVREARLFDVPAQDDAVQPPHAPMASPSTLDLAAQRIATVIWATGYVFDFGWIELPAFDPSGVPVHRAGASPIPGLYFLGLPWLTAAKSSFLFGVGDDAARIAAAIARSD